MFMFMIFFYSIIIIAVKWLMDDINDINLDDINRD